MISRAANRTSSERPSSTSLRPSINPLSFSRVRSDAGILSIGVLPSSRPVAKPDLVGFAYQAKVHPNPFSSKLRTSPIQQLPFLRLAHTTRVNPEHGCPDGTRFVNRN